MKSQLIRQRFFDFFSGHDHRVVRSASIVPANDPTLYFTNAGMVPFKDVFLGKERRDYSRACSSQKCLRVSGKHNDLEAVGRTPKHHTFFEMLGNFSFGDYFKADAIRLAWQFLTEEVGLDADRMVATVFVGEGDIPADDDAFAIWKDQLGLAESRIYRLGSADNFWSMGDQGPCGPCSEIHLLADSSVPMQEALAAGGPAVDDRWVEVWNLVFMQFNRQPDGTTKALAQTGVDTGMGLERLCALVNGLSSTYETDLIAPLVAAVAERAKKRLGDDEEDDVSMRVIADHARAAAFCIADGVFPEKSGREYVLRRIVRRAIRHGHRLGFDQPFFAENCNDVVELMQEPYPELAERSETIRRVVEAEETAFRRTLGRGMHKLKQAISVAQEQCRQHLAEDFVGDLYATDGFPVDLTRTIAEEAGLLIDEQSALEWVARTHGASDTKIGEQALADVYKQLADQLPPTVFSGYQQETLDGSTITALIADEQACDSLGEGKRGELVVDATPFYGRSGGQVGDTGTIATGDATFIVEDTIKPLSGLWIHRGHVAQGILKSGQAVRLAIDSSRRRAIRLNHSATHLLHYALRKVLGEHVAQKGSEVNAEQLRFDFSHYEAMTPEELITVETIVNDEIRKNQVAITEEMSFDESKKTGAMALFGEKYGDKVRVVRIGDHSVELCGGTHVRRSGDIGCLRIIAEEAVAMGVRRVVAVTGERALKHAQQMDATLRQAAAQLKVAPESLLTRLAKLLKHTREQEREIETLKRKLATGGTDRAQASVQDIAGTKLVAMRVTEADPKTLRAVGDAWRDRLQSGVVVLGGVHDNKARILVMVTRDLSECFHAGRLVEQLAPLIDGKGGGRPDMAQAGGANVEGLSHALESAAKLLVKMRA